MMTEEMISADEFCVHHQIELSFIHSLKEAGLIDILLVQDKMFLPLKQLPHLEKMARLYYELDINIEGLEAIHHLLGRMNALKRHVTLISNRLMRYES